jgi:hypothetical protein
MNQLLLENFTYTDPIHPLICKESLVSNRQLPRPSFLHSSPTPKPLVRVACVLVGRIITYVQGCRADLVMPCRSPIQSLCHHRSVCLTTCYT